MRVSDLGIPSQKAPKSLYLPEKSLNIAPEKKRRAWNAYPLQYPIHMLFDIMLAILFLADVSEG